MQPLNFTHPKQFKTCLDRLNIKKHHPLSKHLIVAQDGFTYFLEDVLSAETSSPKYDVFFSCRIDNASSQKLSVQQIQEKWRKNQPIQFIYNYALAYYFENALHKQHFKAIEPPICSYSRTALFAPLITPDGISYSPTIFSWLKENDTDPTVSTEVRLQIHQLLINRSLQNLLMTQRRYRLYLLKKENASIESLGNELACLKQFYEDFMQDQEALVHLLMKIKKGEIKILTAQQKDALERKKAQWEQRILMIDPIIDRIQRVFNRANFYIFETKLLYFFLAFFFYSFIKLTLSSKKTVEMVYLAFQLITTGLALISLPPLLTRAFINLKIVALTWELKHSKIDEDVSFLKSLKEELDVQAKQFKKLITELDFHLKKVSTPLTEVVVKADSPDLSSLRFFYQSKSESVLPTQMGTEYRM